MVVCAICVWHGDNGYGMACMCDVTRLIVFHQVANLQKARSSIFVLLTQSEDAYSVLMAARYLQLLLSIKLMCKI